jgi:hypothetical protein
MKMKWSEFMHQQLDEIAGRLEVRAYCASLQREVDAAIRSPYRACESVPELASNPVTRG